MSDCKSYVSKEDLQALKESQQHIEHVARSRNAAGEKALQVTDPIRGENVTNRTLDGLEDLYTASINNFETRGEDALRSVGWVILDSFQQGAEITERNQVLRDETTGEYYRWDGDLPKSVPAGSTPESAGGVGMGAWVSVGDATLRQVTQYRTNTIATLQSSSFNVGDFISVGGYYRVGDGANHFRVIATEDDGSGVQIANGLWANILYDNYVHVGWFGAVQDGITDDSDAITKAHNFFRFNVKLAPRITRISKPLPIGIGTSYSAIREIGQQWPAGNVVFWNVDDDVSCVFDTRLTEDNILRNFSLSSMRLSPASYRDGFSFINCDIPLGTFEIDHIHLENFTYFFYGKIGNRFGDAGKFVSMGTRCKISDCTLMVDYTIKFERGVAGSAWSNHNYIYDSQLGCIDIDATMQNWNLINPLYEARGYSNGEIGVLKLPLFIARNRIEGLSIENPYIEGLFDGEVSSSDWGSAQASGLLRKEVTIYTSPTESKKYAVYEYNGILYAGITGGAVLGAVDPSRIIPVVEVHAAAKIRMSGGVYSAFQSLIENKSKFYVTDLEFNSPEIFDGGENIASLTGNQLLFAITSPLIKQSTDNKVNLRWFGNKCSYREMSNYSVNLYSTDNIQAIGNYNQTRISGNTTYQSRVKINSPTIYLTTNRNIQNGSGYSQADPLLVPVSLAAIFGTIGAHENIVFVKSSINHISIAALDFPCRITLIDSTINVPMQSFGNPYINAPHGVTFIGSGIGEIRFSGYLPSGSTFDYWINQAEKNYVFRGLSIYGVAGSAVSLINNNADYSPNSLKIYRVTGNGVPGTDRVYASKMAISATTLFVMNNSSGISTR